MHEGHRDRTRNMALSQGLSSLPVHLLLEMALYSSIPRMDTNPIAHELYDHFGGLRGIFEANADELCQIRGVGKSSALLLHLIPELMRRYAEEVAKPVTQYDTLSKIGMYFHRHFIAVGEERLYVMLLNNRMSLIDCVLVSEGTVNASDVPIRKVTELALRKNASTIVLAHNHPNGLAVPSTADLDVTDVINRACNDLGITLLEHLIIADNRFWPIMKQHCGMFRCSPLSKRVESRFFEHFYDVDEEDYSFHIPLPERAQEQESNS